MPASEPLSSPLERYIDVVKTRIYQKINYPNQARQLGFQGTVKLSLHLAHSGEVMNASVLSSSGYSILDDNAVTCAKEVSPYPPFPPSIEKEDLWVEVPIVYSLD